MAAKPSRAAFAFIFITVLLDMLAIGIVIPVLPTLVSGFVGGSAANTAEMLGIFGTVWALMQFLFSPMMGALSDRFGRRPVILISNIGLGLDYILMALAPSLWWLFVGRVISGITAASISTGFAYVADVTPADQRAARFGMLGVAFGVGFVIGPALGGIAGVVDDRAGWPARAGGEALRRAPGRARRARVRDRRFPPLWHRADRNDLYPRHSAHRLVGLCERRRARPDEPACRPRRAGAAARC